MRRGVPDHAGSGEGRWLRGVGQRQAARQGLVAGAVAVRRDVRRHQAGHRREHRADLPGELPESGNTHHYRLLDHRPSAARRGDSARSLHPRRGRDHARHHRGRRAVQLHRRPAPRESRPRAARHSAPAHDARREDHRPPLGGGPSAGKDRRSRRQAGRRGVCGHRHPVQPRVCDADGGDLFRAARGRERAGLRSGSILMFRDHLTFLPEAMTPERVREGLLDVALQLEKKQRTFAQRQGIKLYGELRLGRHGAEAICHSKMLEGHAEPGMVIIGSDSHTPHAGAIGCVAFGVGTTAIFNSWITKDVRLTVPETVKVVVRGHKPENVTAKDFMLEILRHPYVKSGRAIGKLVEYCGDAVGSLSVDERATMTNMTAEVGGFTGYVAPDAKTVEYLREYRVLARGDAERLCAGVTSDPGAEYCEVIEIDAGAIRPMMALPGDPGNGQYIDPAARRIRVDIAYAGSCTAGKKEDMDMYARVLAEAVERGARVAPWVRFYIQCGSQDVKRYCEERGYLELFHKVGAMFLEPSCGACINAGPGVSKTRDEVTISAINRNFPGRSGPGQLYLANPYTVAASAITGYITEWHPGMALAPVE